MYLIQNINVYTLYLLITGYMQFMSNWNSLCVPCDDIYVYVLVQEICQRHTIAESHHKHLLSLPLEIRKNSDQYGNLSPFQLFLLKKYLTNICKILCFNVFSLICFNKDVSSMFNSQCFDFFLNWNINISIDKKYLYIIVYRRQKLCLTVKIYSNN